ncbi:hypothetical protein GLA29479_3076 [Lysobacter antibioticus]|nr:hypothetical protein GLA29479_3076 [Lysobacter antibioticus]
MHRPRSATFAIPSQAIGEIGRYRFVPCRRKKILYQPLENFVCRRRPRFQ